MESVGLENSRATASGDQQSGAVRSRLAGYGVAIATVALGWVSRVVLTPEIGPTALPFIFFFPAIAVSAWLGGLGPAIVALVLSMLAAAWFFIEPVNSFRVSWLYLTVALPAFAISSAFIIVAIEMMRRSKVRLRQEIAARALAEQAHARLAAVVQAARDPIISKTLDGRVTSWNPAAERLFEYSADEMLGQPIVRLFPPDRLHEEERILNSLKEGRSLEHFETVRLTKSGRLVPVEVSISPIRDAGGAIVGAAKVLHDLSERQRIEEQLRQKIEENRVLFETLPIGVFFAHDPECRCITGNAAGCQLLRMTPGANLSKSASDPEKPSHFRVFRKGIEVPPEDLPVQRAAARGEHVRNDELDHVFEDGTVLHTLVSAAPLFDAAGRSRGAVATILDVTERKRAEEALREAEERFRTLFEHAPVETYLIEAETQRILDCNELAARGLGYSREELCKLRVPDIDASLSADETLRLNRQIVEQGANLVIETRHRTRHGEIRDMLITAAPIHVRGRAFNFAAAIDVTIRKRAEQALRENEALLSAVLKQLPVGLGVMDTNGQWIISNAIMDQFVPRGIPSLRPERIGRWRAYDESGHLVPPENWPGRRALRGETIIPGLAMVFTEDDGRDHWLRMSAAPLRDGTGQIIGATCVVQDIDEVKRAEEALRSSQEQLALVSNTVPALISYVDTEYRYRFCNRAYEHWFGLPCEQIIDRTVSELLGEEAWRAVEPHLSAALAGATANFETEAKYAHGGTRWIHAIYTPHRDADGNVRGVVVMVSDITGARRAQGALEEAHRQLGSRAVHLERLVRERTRRLEESVESLESFCYSIAHDLRAPLRAMHSFSTILLEDYAGQLDETARDYACRIADGAARMEALIQALLSYGLVSHIEIPKAPVDLDKTLSRVLADFSDELTAKQATLEVERPLPSHCVTNEVLLEQVLRNLIANALKFTHPERKPRIEVRAESPGNVIRVSIRDNGIGIEEQHHSRLFWPFERIDSGRSVPGVGIGLAIVKKAVDRLGGRVGVVSRAGEGAEFWFELPVEPD